MKKKMLILTALLTALMVLSQVNREEGSALVKPSEWIYNMN